MTLMLGLVALTGALAVSITAAHREYDRAIQAESRRLAMAARAIEERIEGTVKVTDNLLRYVAAEVDRVGIDVFAASQAGNDLLVEAGALLPEIGGLYLLDADGNVAASSRGPQSFNVADREYFQAIKAGHRGLHIGRAIDGRADSKVYFTAARGLHSPNGVLSGVLVAGIEVGHFARFAQSFDVGADGIVAVYRNDGAAVLRHPFDRRILSTTIPDGSLDASRSGLEAVYDTSPIDGRRRLVQQRRMRSLPLYVVVGKTSDEILVQWRRDVAGLAGVAAVILALAFALVHRVRREESMLDQVRASRDRTDMALRMVPVTLAELDRDLMYRWVANFPDGMGGENLLGRTPDEVYGQPLAELRSAAERAWRTGLPDHTEFAVRQDGEIRHFDVIVEPLRTHRGDIVGLRTATLDVSHRVRERQALLAATAAAEEANEAKSRFLAAASHDLRQPLQALNLYHGLIAAQLPDRHPVVVNSGQCLTSLTDMLNDLLDLSKLHAGRVAVKPSVWRIDSVVEAATATIRPDAAAKGLEFRWVPCSLRVRSDKVLFERIALNLMSNAVRYTHRGRVLVGFRRRPGRIEMQVWDTGIGIPADQLDAIFDEFVQVGGVEGAREKGTGLGLAIVRRTADLLGTRVTVESRLGRGSVFRVALPVEEEGLPAPAPASLEPVHGSTRWILVIEDDARVREALRVILEGQEYRVVAAADVSGALRLLRNRGPVPLDLVLADYGLRGGEDGLSAVAQVRRIVGREVPAIILTGSMGPDVAVRVKRAGLEMLTKPVRPDHLARSVDAVIDRSRHAPAQRRLVAPAARSRAGQATQPNSAPAASAPVAAKPT